MVKRIRSPLEYRLASGACVLLQAPLPNLRYRNTCMKRNKSEAGLTDDSVIFNGESRYREIKNTFSLSFCASNETISIAFSFKPWTCLLELYLEIMWLLSVTGSAFAIRNSREAKYRGRCFAESTSSSSEAMSTLCFVTFPTPAASYLSY